MPHADDALTQLERDATTASYIAMVIRNAMEIPGACGWRSSRQ
jgi:hypothetical protein